MACPICNRFQGKWRIAPRSGSNLQNRNRNHLNPKFTWDDILISANSCYCCNILASGCRGCFRQHGIKESDILHCSLQFYYPLWSENAEDEDADKGLTFLMKNGRHFEVEMFVTGAADCPIPDSWDHMPEFQRTSPRTDSDMARVTVNDWIADCITEHDFCDSPEHPYLPTRLVDVGLQDGVVKLVEPQGAKNKYVCLSHCWGAAQIITTTKSTLEERKRGIRWEDLSNTFRDAISLTRTLGFQFIWIDSLCIMQDDLGDWQVESAKMASVYGNGHLTVAGTHSANGHGGLFSRTEDFAVSGKTPDGEDYCLYFRERIDHHIEVADGNMDKGNPTTMYYPLLTRAWVYQERMLSTRVLHFGRYEIFFECRSAIQCECGGIRFHGSSTAAPIPLIKIEHADALDGYDSDQGPGSEVLYHGARLWRTMVCSYTALFLTKSKDRLPAIGGLARDMAARRRSRYLAGLWEETINDDLLWTVWTTSKHKKPRPHPRDAPTWSWASVRTWVLYWDEILFSDIEQGNLDERPPYEHFSKMEKCEVSWSGVDEFGTISHGLLTLSGLVAKGVLEREVETHAGSENIVHYVSFSDMRLAMKTDYLLDHKGPGQTSVGTEVFCLRMSRIQEGPGNHLISLVLKRSPESQGNFERIGTLVISDEPSRLDKSSGPFQAAEMRTVTII